MITVGHYTPRIRVSCKKITDTRTAKINANSDIGKPRSNTSIFLLYSSEIGRFRKINNNINRLRNQGIGMIIDKIVSPLPGRAMLFKKIITKKKD